MNQSARSLRNTKDHRFIQDNINLWYVWRQMRVRCNPKHIRHYRYNGYVNKGITVCEEWNNSSVTFMKWALAHGYKKGLTLERKENSKGYSPDNCTWANRLEQAQNTSMVHFVTAFGDTKSLSAWVRDSRCVVSRSTVAHRLLRGWSPEEALTYKLGMYAAFGEVKCVGEWLKDSRCVVCKTSIYRRLVKGIPFEQAMIR